MLQKFKLLTVHPIPLKACWLAWLWKSFVKFCYNLVVIKWVRKYFKSFKFMVHKVCRMQRNLIFAVDPKPTKNFIWDEPLSWWAKYKCHKQDIYLKSLCDKLLPDINWSTTLKTFKFIRLLPCSLSWSLRQYRLGDSSFPF